MSWNTYTGTGLKECVTGQQSTVNTATSSLLVKPLTSSSYTTYALIISGRVHNEVTYWRLKAIRERLNKATMYERQTNAWRTQMTLWNHSFSQLVSRSRSHLVLGVDPEQVGYSFSQILYSRDENVTGVDLPDSHPTVWPRGVTNFNDVTEDATSTVVLGRHPAQRHAVLGNVGDLEQCRWGRAPCEWVR